MRILFILLISSFFLACEPAESSESDVQKTEDSLVSEIEDNQLIWHYEGAFEASQKQVLQKWIRDVKVGCFETLGEYPFVMNVHFHPSSNNEIPVTFGHTRRNEFNELHFYVNPDAEYEELMNDWTAPHEMSHLAIPFVGKKNQWFSEGFATYLSRRIMVNMELLTEETFDSLYLTKISEMKGQYFHSDEKSFTEIASDLFSNSIYGPVYWAGSGFFLEADRQLQENYNTRFTDVLKSYQSCCRMTDKGLAKVLMSFDTIIGGELFQTLCESYENAPCNDVMKVFD